MKGLIKILVILIGGLFLAMIALWAFIHFYFDGLFTGPFYDKQGLIENFEKKRLEILEVKKYVETKMPCGMVMDVEFDGENLEIFHAGPKENIDNNWGLAIDSPRVDSLLNVVGWTKNDLLGLKEKLDQANCISVSSGEPLIIGWKRSGFGIYNYDVFSQTLNRKLINQYNNGCTYVYYKDNIVLEYRGGVFGPQCFEDFYEN